MLRSTVMRKRTVLQVGLIVMAIVLVAMAIVLLTARPRLEGWLRNTVIATLEEKLGAEVELQQISVRPGAVTRIWGGPLVIRHRAHLDKPPLVRLERFETTMTWRELLRRPRRVDTVTLTGLAISIPLIIWGSQLVLKLMQRFPIIITAGAALLGWVAGEMLVSDHAVSAWIEANGHVLDTIVPAACAVLVVIVGKWLAGRSAAASGQEEPGREQVDPAPAKVG